MAIKPVTRKEAILNGEKIKPVTRLEYFMEKAVQEGGGGSDETELLTA